MLTPSSRRVIDLGVMRMQRSVAGSVSRATVAVGARRRWLPGDVRVRSLMSLASAVGVLAAAPPGALAAPESLSAVVGQPFYCSLHKDAQAAAVTRAKSSGIRARAAYARPPQPKWVTGRESESAGARSHNGVLNVTLNIVRTKVRLGGQTVTATTYNGSYAGPTMRVKPGDTINVTLVNTAGIPDNQPTNLHFHGLHVSPDVPHDNIFVHVEPGQSREYSVTLSGATSPARTGTTATCTAIPRRSSSTGCRA